MALTKDMVREFLAQNDYPSTVYVCKDDFRAFAVIFGEGQRDSAGPLLFVHGCTIRPKPGKRYSKRLDCSASRIFDAI